MRTVLFFLFIVFASTCMMWSAIFTGRNLVTHTIIALGLWGLFFWRWSRVERRKRLRKQEEMMFEAYMRERMKRW